MADFDSAMSILGSAATPDGDPTPKNVVVSQPGVEFAKSGQDDFASRMDVLNQASTGKLAANKPQPTPAASTAASNDVVNYAAQVFSPDQHVAQSAIFHEKGREAGEQASTAATVGLGLQKGTTANFSADMAGLGQASGLPLATPPAISAPIGLARVAADKLGIGSGDATQSYENARDFTRGAFEGMTDAHPVASLGSQVAGSLALPAGAAKTGATLGQVMARGAGVGAGYGALYGAGEGDGVADRAEKAATGAVIGGVVGAAAPAVVQGVAQVPGLVGGALEKIASPVRSLTNPSAEAARQVSGALAKDAASPATGQMLSDADIAAAKAAGQPVTVLDAGGEATRDLARKVANISPEARAALNDTTSGAFQDQSTRTSDYVRDLVGTSGDLPGVRERLQAQAAAANKPAYDRAFADPNGQALWDDTLKSLSAAPALQGAIRDATRTGANKAVAGGFKPVTNPFTFDEAGNMALRSDATPNLQFWDTVKRNLDDQIGALQRSGSKSEAADVTNLRRQLVDHLDSAVPSYQAARGTAASFFGASDALDAGAKFATSRMDNNALRPVIDRMNPAEKKLFAEGFASSLASKVEDTSDRQSIVGKIFQSPAARERVSMALGPDNATRLEAYMRVEGMLDASRRAIQGNSTTARQLASMGVSGGLGAGLNAYYEGSLSPKSLITGALLGSFARNVANRGMSAVDQNVARRVGELLTSGDTEKYRTGIRILSNSPRTMQMLRNATPILARPAAVGTSAAPAAAQ